MLPWGGTFEGFCTIFSNSDVVRGFFVFLILVWVYGGFVFGQSQRLVIEGLKRFSDEDAREILKDHWSEIEKKGLTSSRANDAAFFLRIGLQRQGFAEADVTSRVLSAGVLELRVDEGEPLLLGEIRVDGVDKLDESLLKESMIAEMKKRRFLLESDDNLPFVRSAIESGVDAIQSYARYEGFLRATAELVSIELPDEQRRVNVHVNVREGTQSLIRSVKTRGVEGVLLRKLRNVGDPYEKRPVNVSNTRAIEGECLRILTELGYFNTVISIVQGIPSPDLTDTEVDVIVEIDAGEIYRLKRVHVEGSSALPDGFISKRFNAMLGERYDPVEMRQVYRTLIQTGLYNDLEMTPKPTGDGELTLDVKVEEAKFHHLSVYGGFGSFVGYILGVGHTNRNLFGTGRSFRSAVEINGRGIHGEMNYLDRWFMDSEWQLGVKVHSGSREYEGYTKWDIGAIASFSYDISDHTSVGFYSGFTHVNLTEDSFVDVEIGPSSYQVQELGAAFTWDHREDLDLSGHGYLFEISLDYATSFLIGDISLLKSQMRLAHYWKLPGRTELRLGMRAGIMHPLGDTDVIPVDLRFFSGGSQSVRSFPERELGPQDRRHHPTGGQFYTIFNAEFIVPLQDSFSLAVFGDAGNLLEDSSDYGFAEMHYAAGLGLRYDLPIGPLRVDYGFNLNRERGEPKGTFHIGFGFAF